MKMNFSKDELAMVYQYAAGTKEDTLAGLKEIVPVIRDRQTRDIVENTIRKLDAIPEPECRRFIADTKQRFIQKRDNSIRRRLAEAKAQARTKKPHPKRKEPDGNGHNRFQSRSPWTAPLKEGATIHRSSRCVASCRSPLQGADDFRRFSICSNHHRGSYTSPALAAASYPFVDLPPGNTLRCKLFPSSKFTIHLFPKANGHGIIEPRTI